MEDIIGAISFDAEVNPPAAINRGMTKTDKWQKSTICNVWSNLVYVTTLKCVLLSLT